MANSIITETGDGVTTQYALNFTLGILKRDYVTCRVGSEVDGLGDPVYRTLEWITDGLVNIQGEVPGNNVPIVFTRTMPKNQLIHDYTDGVPIVEKNLDESNLQTMMSIHEFLDGRLESGFVQDLNMNDFKIINLGDGTEDGDAVNFGQLTAHDADITAIQNDIIARQADVTSKHNTVVADQLIVAADKATVAADKATVAGDKATVAADKNTAVAAKNDAEAAAVATAQDAIDTAADRVQTGIDAGNTASDAADTAADRIQVSADAAQVALDLIATQAARDATLTAFDNFDDRYLGAKTSDPSVDNDGNALVAGALYFNSMLPAMKVYTGTIWVAAYVSGTDFLAIANNLSDLSNKATARNNLELGASNDVTFGSVTTATMTLQTSGALRTGTSNGNTLKIQARDVDGAAYTDFITLTAGNTPTCDLSSAVTHGGQTILTGTIGTSEIDDEAVDNTKLAHMAEATIKGRAAGAGTGDADDLTGTEATAILDAFTGDSGSGGVKGLVPAPSSGDADAGKVLGAGGGWVTPAAGSMVKLLGYNAATGPFNFNSSIITSTYNVYKFIFSNLDISSSNMWYIRSSINNGSAFQTLSHHYSGYTLWSGGGGHLAVQGDTQMWGGVNGNGVWATGNPGVSGSNNASPNGTGDNFTGELTYYRDMGYMLGLVTHTDTSQTTPMPFMYTITGLTAATTNYIRFSAVSGTLTGSVTCYGIVT
jgi:hypothetical protein